MPKLLLFVPCEKVIIDPQNNPTLIVVLNNINIQVPEGDTVPENVVTPREWDVVTIIEPANGDQGKEFVQELDLRYPDGATPMTSKISFKFNDNLEDIARNHVHFVGMPVSQVGQYLIRLWIYGKSSGKPPEPLASYPLYIRHQSVPKSG